MDPQLIDYYEKELAFLRDMGAEFAAEFPKVAARLDLGTIEVADPYVERLMEGFAFLAARIQLKMAAEFPTFTQSLLQMVYPHYLAPTPSMAIVKVTPDTTLRNTPQGVELPAGLELRSLLGTEDQTNCEFRTAHAMRLMPLDVAEADYIGTPAAVAALGLNESAATKAAIRLRVRTSGEIPLAKLGLERLSFFLGGPDGARIRLYEQLSAHVTGVVVRPGTRPVPWQERLPPASLRPAGFAADEALLPRLATSFDGYRLLQEYFAMPERFLFFTLSGLERATIRCAATDFEIIILLDRADAALLAFGPDHMQLYCTPAINLFRKRSDRVSLADRESEHLIVPDRMRPLDYEVFSVLSMEGFAADGGSSQPFFPFYAASDLSRNPGHRSYYALRRQPHRPSSRARERGAPSSYLGHDVFVSLVDADNAPVKASLRQLGLDLLCTNRDLAIAMPVGKRHTDFTIAVNAPVASVRCVVGPTVPRPCRGDGDYAWRFISHLGLNYLTLTDNSDAQGAAALRELLRLYVPDAASDGASRQVDALRSVSSTPVVRRIPGAGPVCAGRGLKVVVTIDEPPFGGGGILLGAVLDQFFAKYVSINSFTETVLRSPDRGEIMRWPLQLRASPGVMSAISGGSRVADEGPERRLAAILAADVVGYSRQMAADEIGTLTRLRALRKDVIDPLLAEHRGRLFKTMGDGFLVEFASAVQALRCAVAMQQRMADGYSRTQLRIGVHQGDVVVEGDDLFGDGVNIAARLESVADPGGICISARVQEDAAGKLTLDVADLGTPALKNIDRPIQVFRVLLGGVDQPGPTQVPPLPAKPNDNNKPSIAVLPFQNMSGDAEQEYFADGMVEDIITALSRIPWFFVIARNSTFRYKGKAMDIRQVGRELGVRYVLEGSVRKAGNRVRITGQLIDAVTGSHIWADRFDGGLEDVFDLQDRVASSVAGVIEPELRAAEIRRTDAVPTSDLTAYDLFLRAQSLAHSWEQDATVRALGFLGRAIERDAEYGPALAAAAERHVDLHDNGWTSDPPATQRKGIEFSRRALLAGSNDPNVLSQSAYTLAYFGEELDPLFALLDRNLRLNPNFARNWLSSAWLRLWDGQLDLAKECFETALRLNPREQTANPRLGIGVAHFFARRFVEATALFNQSLQEKPNWVPTYRFLAACHAHSGRLDEARETVGSIRTLTNLVVPSATQWRNPEHREFYLAGLRLAADEKRQPVHLPLTQKSLPAMPLLPLPALSAPLTSPTPVAAMSAPQRLNEAPQRYDFFATMRLLEALNPDRPGFGRSSKPAQDLLRLGQAPTLSHAAAALAGFEPGTDGRADRLQVHFLGLFGPDGPLPLHLTEYARDRCRNHGDATLQRFADLFHHRALSLFYRAWANVRPTVSFDRPEQDRFSHYVRALIGLATPEMRDRDAMPDLTKLHFAGLLAGQTRHAEGLGQILSAFFAVPVRVESFQGAWLDLPRPDWSRLSGGAATAELGKSALLGSRVWGRQHKFCLVLGPLSLAEYQRLLPGGLSFHRLVPIVRNYAGDALIWSVTLVLRAAEVPPIRLGQQGRLGWTAWLMPRSKQTDAADLHLDASADSYASSINGRDQAMLESAAL